MNHSRILLASILTAYAIGAASIVAAHDAMPTATQPLGWQYDYTCCSVRDCSRAGAHDIEVTKEGYRVKLTKEVIPWSDTRIKRSKDEYYHRCVPGGNVNAQRSLCLYVPDAAG